MTTKLGTEVDTLAATDAATDWVESPDRLSGYVIFDLAFTSWVGSLNFEGRLIGGATARSVRAEKLDDGTLVTVASSNGLYRVDAAGLQVRVKANPYTSGSVAVARQVSIG